VKLLHFLAKVGKYTELSLNELAQQKLSQKVKSPDVLVSMIMTFQKNTEIRNIDTVTISSQLTTLFLT